VALHPIEAEQLTHLLTQMEEHRRIIAVLSHLLLKQLGLPPQAELVLTQDDTSYLGACLTASVRLHMDRRGNVRLTIERGHY
jgi:hypothetical protein